MVKKTKIIAFYLPQFHTFPENDAWWGKGFTEWTNVRKAKSYFKGHHQPEVPWQENYYNLLDANAQEHQAALAHTYGVDGFCYYHYWFSGKLLMEKPMENMLANSAINEPFCICWANEHWSRNWDGKNKKIIMPQNYEESEEAWAEHFRYLLPFFRDKRYIRHENKPVFILYKPYLIKNCDAMITYWQKLAREAGLEGLYMGYQDPQSFSYNMSSFDFGIEFEPNYSIYELGHCLPTKHDKILYGMKHWHYLFYMVCRELRKKYNPLFLHKPFIIGYDDVWHKILRRCYREKIMPGAFTSWDNTPRRGIHGVVYHEATPKKFRKYMTAALQKANEAEKEFLFINAWNEWGEGAHLEPDERNGFGYLEAVRHAISELSGGHER